MTSTFAAVHLHSSWSYDGHLSLSALVHVLGGWASILLMSEHDRGFTSSRYADYKDACHDASTAAVRVIPGIEYSDPTNTIHILVWGLSHFLGEGLDTLHTLRAAAEGGALVVMAHPSRKHAWRAFDSTWIEYLDGIELWNRKTDGLQPSTHARSLLRETRLRPFVGMDFHTRRQLFPLLMRLPGIDIHNESAVLHALRSETPSRPMLGPLPVQCLETPLGRALTVAADSARRRLLRRRHPKQ